jgi:hypothetical protein
MTLFYTGYPIINKSCHNKISIINNIEEGMKRDTNDTILILRYFRYENSKSKEKDVNINVMKKIRQNYSTVIFFDDADGAGDTRFEVLPFVDKYLKKQTFHSLEKYRRRLYGRHLFTDYYHKEYNINDDRAYTRVPLSQEADATKIRTAWNLGVGVYPIRPYLQRLGVALVRLAGVAATISAICTPV